MKTPQNAFPIEKDPDEFKDGPKHLVTFLNWTRSIIQGLRGLATSSWPLEGEGVSIGRSEYGSIISIRAGSLATPFRVTRGQANNVNGFLVSNGYLIDRLQSTAVNVTNIGGNTLLPSSTANAYVYLDVSTSGGNVTGATVKVSATGWAGFPNIATFTADPFAYNGNGTPPTQTNAYLTLAKFTNGANVPVKQVVTTHLQMQLVTYGGLPALFPFAGHGPNDPPA